MKGVGIFLSREKNTEGIFWGLRKKDEGIFWGMLKKLVTLIDRQILKL